MAEIITCPNCQRKLQVPESYFGKTVQCPECKQNFQAPSPQSPMPAPTAASPPPLPQSLTYEIKDDPDEEDRPRRHAGRDLLDEDDDPPRRRRRRYDDEDDDDFDPRQVRRRRHLEPHRAGLIFTFGLLSFVFWPVGIVLGPLAWIFGSTDLAKMREGTMDREGEGLTQAGRVLGIIYVVLAGLSLFGCCVFGILGSMAPNGHF